MKKKNSVFPSIFFIPFWISFFLTLPFTGFGKEVLGKKSIEEMIKDLASSDSDVVENTISSLAQTGDSRLETFFELYRQGSVYNWPNESGGVRIVVNEETVMDDDFNEFAPLLEPLSGQPFLIEGKQAKPDLLELEDRWSALLEQAA